MAPKATKVSKSQQKAPEPAKEYPTIAAKLEAEYLASRPYQVLKETKGLSNLSAAEKAAYINSRFLETGAWRSWPEVQQKEFWKQVEQQKIPRPLDKPRDLGKDWRGRDISTYTVKEFEDYLIRLREIATLREKSTRFIRKRERGLVEGKDIEEERNRRKLLGHFEGKRMGKYEVDPEWDDVMPLPQDDGENALAAIAYTEEYSEAMGYLRAVMASKEYSPRVLTLTEHIISLNASHYTVWLYRLTTLLALNSPVDAELVWINEVALENQKNYQIWQHRQVLIDHVFPTLSTPEQKSELAKSEREFMTKMFDEDSKNYHVWSYRQYLVRKLGLWDDKEELNSVEQLLRGDVRNNSAWSHRFFLVFSNPRYTTPDSKATEPDPKIPAEIIDRELLFAQAATFEAPQNPSPWNYIRGVLRKGDRKLASVESFAGEFVKLGEEGEEVVRSSHALDFLADVWAEKGEVNRAGKALELLGEKYDRIRKNYWEWRREGLLAGMVEAVD